MESRDSSPGNLGSTLEELRDEPALQSRGLAVVDVLGEGGSSIVYRARDERHGRDVAVKVLRLHPALPSAAERFQQEIRVAGGLRHVHLLPLHDSGALQDGRLFLVMPVARGRPLSAMIREGPLTVADAVRLAREVAEALAHLHENGYVHRDVKPENILVESGHAVLTDFGLAVPRTELAGKTRPTRAPEDWWKTVSDEGRFTRSGSAVGTVPYMSPEAMQARDIDGRADIFSLGIVLYEMLSGVLPFGIASPEQIIGRLSREGIPGIRALRPEVPRELEAIIARCTAMEPGARFASADALAAALSEIPTDATRAGILALARERRIWSLGLVVILLASILGVATWFRERQRGSLDPRRVVVADLANDTGDSALARVGVLAGDLITAALTEGSNLTVVNAAVALPSRQQRLLPPADSTLARETRALVLSAQAGLVVTGAYFMAGRDLEVIAELTDTRSGRVIGTAGPIHAAMSHPDSSLRVLGDSVLAVVRRRHAPPE